MKRRNKIESTVTNLDNLSFSLYAALSVYYMVATSDDGKKSEMRVSADWYIVIEY